MLANVQLTARRGIGSRGPAGPERGGIQVVAGHHLSHDDRLGVRVVVTPLLAHPRTVRIGSGRGEFDRLHRDAVSGLGIDAFLDHRVMHRHAADGVCGTIRSLHLDFETGFRRHYGCESSPVGRPPHSSHWPRPPYCCRCGRASRSSRQWYRRWPACRSADSARLPGRKRNRPLARLHECARYPSSDPLRRTVADRLSRRRYCRPRSASRHRDRFIPAELTTAGRCRGQTDAASRSRAGHCLVPQPWCSPHRRCSPRRRSILCRSR